MKTVEICKILALFYTMSVSTNNINLEINPCFSKS